MAGLTQFSGISTSVFLTNLSIATNGAQVRFQDVFNPPDAFVRSSPAQMSGLPIHFHNHPLLQPSSQDLEPLMHHSVIQGTPGTFVDHGRAVFEDAARAAPKPEANLAAGGVVGDSADDAFKDAVHSARNVDELIGALKIAPFDIGSMGLDADTIEDMEFLNMTPQNPFTQLIQELEDLKRGELKSLGLEELLPLPPFVLSKLQEIIIARDVELRSAEPVDVREFFGEDFIREIEEAYQKADISEYISQGEAVELVYQVLERGKAPHFLTGMPDLINIVLYRMREVIVEISSLDPKVAGYVGISPVMESSATGTRGTLTIPASIASIKEKSDTTHGNNVPSAKPEP